MSPGRRSRFVVGDNITLVLPGFRPSRFRGFVAVVLSAGRDVLPVPRVPHRLQFLDYFRHIGGEILVLVERMVAEGSRVFVPTVQVRLCQTSAPSRSRLASRVHVIALGQAGQGGGNRRVDARREVRYIFGSMNRQSEVTMRACRAAV
jgi:hypothetical protein